MKKLFTTCLAAVMLIASMFTFVACAPKALEPATGTAYGASHTQTLTRWTLTLDKNSKVTDARMDEVFLPHDWTLNKSTGGNSNDQSKSAIGYTVGGFIVPYKFTYTEIFSLASEMPATTAAEITARSRVLANSVDPNAAFITGSIAIPTEFQNRMIYGTSLNATLGENSFYRGILADYYIDQAIAGNVFLLQLGTAASHDFQYTVGQVASDASGLSDPQKAEIVYYKKVTPAPVSATINKWDDQNTYWGSTLVGVLNARYSYKENVQLMIDYIKENLSYTSDVLGATRTTPESTTFQNAAGQERTVQLSYWIVDGITTGATLDDFRDYLVIAKQAYSNAYAAQLNKARG
jgi:hypothetical protein